MSIDDWTAKKGGPSNRGFFDGGWLLACLLALNTVSKVLVIVVTIKVLWNHSMHLNKRSIHL
jgi:hypothetical protein